MAGTAAKELQKRLNDERNTLLKCLSKSQVGRTAYLGGFGDWRKAGLLFQQTTDMAFEYRGEHWPVRYLAENSAFSGGWGAFSEALGLCPGDTLLFHRKAGNIVKVYVIRAADYADAGAEGWKAPADPYYEDAPQVNFKNRAIKEGSRKKTPPAEGEAPAAKKQRTKAVEAAGTNDARTAAPLAATAAGSRAGTDSDVGVVAEIAAAGATVAGMEGRRNPGRAGKPAPGALKVNKQQLVVVVEPTDKGPKRAGAGGKQGKQAAAGGEVSGVVGADAAPPEKKVRRPRAQKDPNAPPRAPKAPKDPNAPPKKPRAPPKKKKLSIWEYKFNDYFQPLVDQLKARHAECCVDGVKVDKKTDTVLEPYNPRLVMNGYTMIKWIENDDRTFRPIHCLFDRERDGLRDYKSSR